MPSDVSFESDRNQETLIPMSVRAAFIATSTKGNICFVPVEVKGSKPDKQESAPEPPRRHGPAVYLGSKSYGSKTSTPEIL